jgi:anhydro-N-acetylmuramic acid kinase
MPGTNNLFIGLMSGTSVDAIDAVLVRFKDHPASTEFLAMLEHPFPDELRDEIHQLIENSRSVDLDQLGSLDRRLGLLYAEAVRNLLTKAGTRPEQVTAIGNHGQTIRHRPDASPPFTMQIGDAATIANTCKITTVADFRSADIALGGQAAPLAPAFHQWVFGSNDAAGAVINIGGIANITVMQPDLPLLGYDTGPGNTLLDAWFRNHNTATYDHDGQWAATGSPIETLLGAMLADPYFSLPSPKSTGREYFNSDWLNSHLSACAEILDPADVQATLTELTAVSIANAVKAHQEDGSVWLCGGGALNPYLRERLAIHLSGITVDTTTTLGIEPDWVEAATFAWLARERLRGNPVGPSTVTGASHSAVLGSIHLPPKP